MLQKLTVLIIFLLLFVSNMVFAGVTGKLKGVVTDKNTGEGLIAANVVILGTGLGAATDFEGNYFIINITPGTYDVKVSYMGFENVVIKGVRIFSDKTTQQDVQLVPETFETEEIVVSGAREVVEIDRTNTASYISGEQINNLPVQEVGELLQLQTGVVRDAGGNLHIRGGRSGEIAYLIDGVPVSDQYRGGSSIGLENNWIQELQVISGTFNAEYGQAQSGIVNIVTKEGAKKFGGNISLSAGDYVTSNNDVFMNLDDYGLGESDMSLNLYGPIPGLNALSYYTSFRYYNTDGWLYGQRRTRIEDTVPIQMFMHEASQNQSNEERLIGIEIPDSLQTGDNAYVAMNPQEKLSFYGKASATLSTDIRVRYSLFYSKSESKSYSDSRRYAPDGTRTLHREDFTHIVNLNHILSNRTFYSLSISYTTKNQKYYLFNNPLDSRYRGSAYSFEGFYYGGTDNGRSDITNSSIIVKLDLTSQVDNYNQVKFGGEFKLHKLDYFTMSTISDAAVYLEPELRIPAENTAGNNTYIHEPVEASLYLQDKLELNELIVNAGLRLDYWDPNASIPENLRAETKSSDGIRLNTDFVDADTRLQFSPRFGLAYPISATGVVHVSYGHFFQLPRFNAIYTNSEFEVELGGLQTTMGNANLKPERTVNYEIGLQQKVNDFLNTELTFYYKDINNLLSQEIINTQDKKVYARYINRDYGNVKGFILSFKTSNMGKFSGSIDYTYQVAKGNASDPNSVFVDFQSSPPAESEKQVIPLDWDQRHTLNASLAFGNPGDWNIGLIGRFATGQPYTPSNPSSQLTDQFENSDRKPSILNIDLNFYKLFKINEFTVKLFCKVFNLTDRLNQRYVYSSTGNADFPYRSYAETEILRQNPNFTLDEIDLRPDFYSEPRKVVVGVGLEF